MKADRTQLEVSDEKSKNIKRRARLVLFLKNIINDIISVIVAESDPHEESTTTKYLTIQKIN